MNNLKVAREPFLGLKSVSLVAFLYFSGWQLFQGGDLAIVCPCSAPSGTQVLGGNKNNKSMGPEANKQNRKKQKGRYFLLVQGSINLFGGNNKGKTRLLHSLHGQI